MDTFSFSGLEWFDKCNGTTADQIVEEECMWWCKNGRPYIRCTYDFDSTGRYGFETGAVDVCNV